MSQLSISELVQTRGLDVKESPPPGTYEIILEGAQTEMPNNNPPLEISAQELVHAMSYRFVSAEQRDYMKEEPKMRGST